MEILSELLDNFEVILFAILFFTGLITGSIIERAHFRSIEKRTKALINEPLVNYGKFHDPQYDEYEGVLVVSEVVISIDYFKKVVANICNFFGGSLVSYESLCDRARKEAILRLKETAQGASMIINAKLETSSISDGAENSVQAVEVIAYGTALYRKK